MKISCLSVVYLIFTFNLHSQVSIQLREVSLPEKVWVITHPFIAKKAIRISTNSKLIANSKAVKDTFGNDGNGGALDAFRHAFWMCSLSNEIGCRRALKLGVAHEKGNRKDFEKGRLEDGQLPDKASIDMDLHNNSVGVTLCNKREEVTQDELITRVLTVYLGGKLVVIKKDTLGNSLSVDGEVIPINDWRGQWENARVLVPSNCF